MAEYRDPYTALADQLTPLLSMIMNAQQEKRQQQIQQQFQERQMKLAEAADARQARIDELKLKDASGDLEWDISQRSDVNLLEEYPDIAKALGIKTMTKGELSEYQRSSEYANLVEGGKESGVPFESHQSWDLNNDGTISNKEAQKGVFLNQLKETEWGSGKITVGEDLKNFYGDSIPSQVTRDEYMKLVSNPNYTKVNSPQEKFAALELEKMTLPEKISNVKSDAFDLTLIEPTYAEKKSEAGSYDVFNPYFNDFSPESGEQIQTGYKTNVSGLGKAYSNRETTAKSLLEGLDISPELYGEAMNIALGETNKRIGQSFEIALQNAPSESIRKKLIKDASEDIGTRTFYQNQYLRMVNEGLLGGNGLMPQIPQGQ